MVFDINTSNLNIEEEKIQNNKTKSTQKFIKKRLNISKKMEPELSSPPNFEIKGGRGLT